MSVLRGHAARQDVARALGISVRTQEACATEVGAKWHLPISSAKLANLMSMAGNIARDAAAEFNRAARDLRSAA